MFKQKILALTATTFFLLLSFVISAQHITPDKYSANVPVNYVRTWDAKAPQTDPNTITVSSPLDSFVMTTQYVDGLGRPIQTVVKGITPLGKDLVSATTYDEFGREQYKYLPFAANSFGGNTSISDGLFKLNPFQQDSVFSKAQYPGESYFYSQQFIEASPLNRVLESFAPGDSWAGTAGQSSASSRRSVKMDYSINSVSDSVRIWSVTSTVNAVPTTAATYPAGELYKGVTTDEGGKQVVEYKDKEGKVVLKKVQLAATPGTAHVGWLCTYYIYDDLGELRFVLQPSAITTLQSAGNWTVTNLIRDELCFYYGYDGRGRMNIKKVPGAGEVWMVYDGRDRLVMTQDANMRTGTAKWMVNLYDGLNRPVKTGLYTSSADRATHQSGADASPSSPYPFAADNPPSSGFELLTQMGYDDYLTLPSGAPSSSITNTYITSSNFFTTYNASPDYAQALTQSLQTRGLPTWSAVKVLGTTNTFLYATSIYDEKGRVIQIKSTNISGGTDIATTQYDFSGKVIRSHIAHQKSGPNADTYQLLTKMAYDGGGRLLNIKKRVNSSSTTITTDKTILVNTYDELGQLKTKKLAADYNSGAGLETMSYDYNIRGWLLGANRDYAKSSSSTTNYFGFDLGYDKTGIASGSTSIGSYTQGSYNGNITGTVWKSKGDNQIRKYDFSYDAVNRLTGADFNQYTSGFNKTAAIDYSVSNLSYDANGNILSMAQRGWKIGGSVAVDQLRYTYLNSGVSNRLQNVIDTASDATTVLGDFRSSSLYMSALGTKTTGAVDYSYDDNGNLVKDKNKDIETYGGANGIEYNYLNLPQKITVKASGSANKGIIEYTYDAAGTKLKKVTTEGSKVTTTLYLLGNYINDTLQFLPQEEGRIRPTTDVSQPFAYDYMLKDHLGNVRIVLTEEQKVNVYPAATLEGSLSTATDAAYVEKQYYSIDPGSVVAQSDASGISTYQNNNGNPPVNNNPNSSTTANSAKLYKLAASGSGGVIGLGITLKVMSGDRIDIFGKSYYYQNNAGCTNYSLPVLDVLTGMFGAPSSIAGLKGASATGVNGVSSINTDIGSFLTNSGRNGGTTPKAAINYILLDEQFNYAGGGFSNVGSSGTLKDHGSELSNIPVPKNGYIYIYVSNQSPTAVYFDNLQVIHTPGPMLEETHYYPFGLAMAGISSKAAGRMENKKKYNSIELNSDFDLNLGESFYRSHDPQLGRWWQIDPKPNENMSPYSVMNNNPILMSDPLGDTTWVYNQNGVFCGVVNDRLKNQVDYVSTEADPGKPFDVSKLSAKEAKALGQKIREVSIAFIGVNTVSDMKSIAKLAMGKQKEIGFVGTVGKDKEIRLNILPIDASNKLGEVSIGAQIDKNYPSGQNSLFLDGHTHIAAFLAPGYYGDGSDMAQQKGAGQPTRTADYAADLDRGKKQGVKGAAPSLIVTPVGFTAYGSAVNPTYSTPLSTNNSYLIYKNFK